MHFAPSFRATLAIAALAVLPLRGAWAEPAESGRGARTIETGAAVVDRSNKPAAGTERRAKDGRTVRCWQYGRLILEEPVAARFAGDASRSYRLNGREEPQGPELLDLRTALCLIQ